VNGGRPGRICEEGTKRPLRAARKEAEEVDGKGDGGRFISLRQFAEMLGVHPDTARKIVRRGDVEAYNFGPGSTRIAREDAERFVEASRLVVAGR
jgi:excisionase family DNA binding protein